MSVQLKDTTEVEDLWDAITSGRVSYTSYANLLAAVTRPIGSMAEVTSADTGEHDDPVSTDTVPNAGVYRLSSSGWQWLRELPEDLEAEAKQHADDAEDAATTATASATVATNLSNMKPYKNWAALFAVTGAAGNMAIIPVDAATHTDPVVGGTVQNAGIYAWHSTSPTGWERTGDTPAAIVDAALESATAASNTAGSILSIILAIVANNQAYATKAAATAAVGGLTVGTFVLVAADESHSGEASIYAIVAGPALGTRTSLAGGGAVTIAGVAGLQAALDALAVVDALKAALAGPQTLTDTRVNKRVVAAAGTSGTQTPNADLTDVYKATGLTGTTTIGAPSGTKVDGQPIIVYLKDNGTARTIAWNTAWRAEQGVTLPLATVASKHWRIAAFWNADDSKWDVVSVLRQA